MYYNETSKTININNLMPSEEYSTSDYFEFQVSGKNTYTEGDIYYEIVLDNGEYEGDDLNRTIPIDSQLLKFKLVEVVNGEEVEIFNNRTYSDITNKRIWVDTIGVDDGDYSKTYRLYARIDEYTNICGGEANDYCDYYINPSAENQNLDWNKLYASIKVNVKGDLEEKSIETPASCFTYEVVTNERKIVNPVMETQSFEENELFKCMQELNNSEMFKNLDSGSTLMTYCQGTGTTDDGSSLQDEINTSFSEESLENFVNLNIIIKDGKNYILNPIMVTQNLNELSRCVGVFENSIYDSSSAPYGREFWISYCQGIGYHEDIRTLQIELDYNYAGETFSLDFQKRLTDLNIILTKTREEINFLSYDSACGSDVIIPRQIDGYPVSRINTIEIDGYAVSFLEQSDVKNVVLLDNITEIVPYAFQAVHLETIEIPDSVIIIGESAFAYNNLKDIEIPNNLTYLAHYLFYENKLRSVMIPNNVRDIGYCSFYKNEIKLLVIPENVYYIRGYAFYENKIEELNFEPISHLKNIELDSLASNRLKELIVPDSVKLIGDEAFKDNKLETVTIGSSIEYIGFGAFKKNNTSNSNLSTITFTSKNCEEIKNIENGHPYYRDKAFPWLYYNSPYYEESNKATIIGTDGECSY